MTVYDITQEMFSCNVYPGDSQPERIPSLRISGGDICNLTDMTMCLHNGTHIDAPFHFFADGKTIDKLDLGKCMGNAVVKAHSGVVTYETARRLMVGNPKKLLIKGSVSVSPEAAEYFVEKGLELIGVEEQSVADSEYSVDVHRILLEAEIVILEGIVLKTPPCGEYYLSALPLKLEGCDGSPCRALLFEK